MVSSRYSSPDSAYIAPDRLCIPYGNNILHGFCTVRFSDFPTEHILFHILQQIAIHGIRNCFFSNDTNSPSVLVLHPKQPIECCLHFILTERGLILKKGTIVDSTIISAPSSTKNKEKQRDPEAHSTKKGNVWYYGYKAHVGVDKDSGLVHTVEVTAANEHDVNMTSKLLHGEEETAHGDSGYIGADKREDTILKNKNGKKIKYNINRRPSQFKFLFMRCYLKFYRWGAARVPAGKERL